MVKKLDLIDTKNWLTPKEVATILKYKRTDRVYELIDAGEFDVFNRGTVDNPSYLINPASVADFQRRRIVASKRKEAAAESPLPYEGPRYV